MAKVFLDTNYFIGFANRAPEIDTESLGSHQAFVSVLSCHILFYVNKIKVPDIETSSFIKDFNLVELGPETLYKALDGPTPDLEDNIQLHSAAESECDFFLTQDKKLLNLKYFGKTRISQELNSLMVS